MVALRTISLCMLEPLYFPFLLLLGNTESSAHNSVQMSIRDSNQSSGGESLGIFQCLQVQSQYFIVGVVVVMATAMTPS